MPRNRDMISHLRAKATVPRLFTAVSSCASFTIFGFGTVIWRTVRTKCTITVNALLTTKEVSNLTKPQTIRESLEALSKDTVDARNQALWRITRRFSDNIEIVFYTVMLHETQWRLSFAFIVFTMCEFALCHIAAWTKGANRLRLRVWMITSLRLSEGMYCLNGTTPGVDDQNTHEIVDPLYQVRDWNDPIRERLTVSGKSVAL